MKKHSWISPLGERISKTPFMNPSSLGRSFSIITPELVYYYLSQIVTYGAAYIIGTGQYGTKTSAFFREHSLFCAAFIRSIAIIIAVAPLIVAFKNEHPVLLPKSNSGAKYAGLVAVVAASSSLLFNSVAIVSGFAGSSKEFGDTASAQFSLPIWAGILLYGMITPVTEEIVHRGLIYNRLRRYFNLPIAVVGSALIFGVFHGNIVQLIYGSVMGLLLAYVYERFGAFVYPVLFHCVANTVIYGCMSIPQARATVLSTPGIVVEASVLVAGIVGMVIQKDKSSDKFV